MVDITVEILATSVAIPRENLRYKIKTWWAQVESEPSSSIIQLPTLPMIQHFYELNEKETTVFVEMWYQNEELFPKGAMRFLGMAKQKVDIQMKNPTFNPTLEWLEMYDPIEDILRGKILLKIDAKFTTPTPSTAAAPVPIPLTPLCPSDITGAQRPGGNMTPSYFTNVTLQPGQANRTQDLTLTSLRNESGWADVTRSSDQTGYGKGRTFSSEASIVLSPSPIKAVHSSGEDPDKNKDTPFTGQRQTEKIHHHKHYFPSPATSVASVVISGDASTYQKNFNKPPLPTPPIQRQKLNEEEELDIDYQIRKAVRDLHLSQQKEEERKRASQFGFQKDHEDLGRRGKGREENNNIPLVPPQYKDFVPDASPAGIQPRDSSTPFSMGGGHYFSRSTPNLDDTAIQTIPPDSEMDDIISLLNHTSNRLQEGTTGKKNTYSQRREDGNEDDDDGMKRYVYDKTIRQLQNAHAELQLLRKSTNDNGFSSLEPAPAKKVSPPIRETPISGSGQDQNQAHGNRTYSSISSDRSDLTVYGCSVQGRSMSESDTSGQMIPRTALRYNTVSTPYVHPPAPMSANLPPISRKCAAVFTYPTPNPSQT